MKKGISMLLAGMSLLLAPAAYADPVTLTGEVSVKYERDTAVDMPAVSGAIYTLKLLGEAQLGNNWSMYTRLGAQGLATAGLGDFNTDSAVYGPDKKWVLALDQFGINYKSEKLTYKLGRQDATVGTTALLYSRPDTNIGKKAFVDGLSVSGSIGVADVSALLAREDNPAGTANNKIYAAHLGLNPTDKFNWGLTLGRYQASENASTDHWAVDGTYHFDKSSLSGEYTKSSSSTDNQAYAVTWNYGFDDKTAVYVTGFRVEDHGDMGGQSDFDHGNRGVYYGITHKVNDAANLEIVYKDQRDMVAGIDNTKLEATMSYSF